MSKIASDLGTATSVISGIRGSGRFFDIFLIPATTPCHI